MTIQSAYFGILFLRKPLFCNIKFDQGFKHNRLKSSTKVSIEF